jgi:hypothetical protein
MTKPTNKARPRRAKKQVVNKNREVVAVSQPSWQRQLLSGALSTGGALIGGPAGATVGHTLANLIANWRGYGAYNISKNSLFTSPVPAMHSSNETTVIRHREYITDIITSSTASTFLLNTYAVNPGLDNTFPWLSTLASQYQEYKVRGMVFEFVSTSADALNSVNTALGSVIFASRYRANSQPFINKQQMLNEYFSCDGKPSCSFVHPIECNPRESPSNLLYIRTGSPAAANDDLKWYDLCEVDVATQGFQGTSVNVGELWVSYEIELLKPQISGQGLDLLSQYAHYTMANASAAAYFGTSRQANFDNIGMAFDTLSMYFPNNASGTYLVLYNVITSSAGAATGPTLTFTNCTFIINGFSNLWSGATGNDNQPGIVSNSATSAYVTRCFFVQIAQSDVNAKVTLGGGTYPAGGFGDIIITQIPTPITAGVTV